MKTEVRTIYRCDHCNKLYLNRKACKTHEKRCFHNPDNYRVCYDCEYLTKKAAKSIKQDEDNNHVVYSLFYCTKINKFTHPPKVDQKGNRKELVSHVSIPMKRKCKFFQLAIGGY